MTDNHTIERYNFSQYNTRNTNLVSLVYLVTVVNLYISRSNFLLTHEMLSKTVHSKTSLSFPEDDKCD